MKTEILSANESDAITQALAVLRRNGVVAFPTDTVYGVGALAFQPEGIERLFAVKDRPKSLAIPVLIASVDDLEAVSPDPGETALKLGERFWPGPLTLVVPRHPDLPAELSQSLTIGVRVPDHPIALAVLREAGPLAVTSANRSGGENTYTAEEVFAQLGGRVDLIVDGGTTPGSVPSTVVDLTGDEVEILRQGPIGEGEIRIILG